MSTTQDTGIGFPLLRASCSGLGGELERHGGEGGEEGPVSSRR